MEEEIKKQWSQVVLRNLYQTCGINNAIASDHNFAGKIMDCLRMYTQMDWGDTCAADCKMNNSAVCSGDDRVVALYKTNKGNVFIITEWDRSVTTILFGSEY